MAMKVIWAPWRMSYINEEKPSGCIFCEKPKGDDSKMLILFRGRYSFAIMNKYPYNNGHIMVAPYKHISNFEDLTADEFSELFRLFSKSINILKRKFCADGINAGLNLGKVAGAGVLDHVHLHIVPRWNGDTNFMPVIAETKVMPQHLKSTYNQLKEEFKKITIS